MSEWYDRNGKSIEMIEALKLMSNLNYQRIKEDTLPDGKYISTVWLGMDHNFSNYGSPLIFETMVFPKHGKWGELDCDRYSTLEEALRWKEAK